MTDLSSEALPMKRLIRLLSWGLALVGLWYCLYNILNGYNTLPAVSWNLQRIIKVALIFPMAFLTALPFCEAWRILLAAVDTSLSYRQSYAILGISQIGKYLPGNIFHYVGRATLAVRQGIPSSALLISVWFETLLVIIVAAVLVMSGAAIDSTLRNWAIVYLSPNSMRVMWIVLVLILGSGIGLMFWNVKLDIFRNLRGYINIALLGKVCLLYLLIFILYGCMVKFITVVLLDAGTSFTLLQAIWRFSLCYLAGFIVPGAPAGIGVREALFTILFSEDLGSGGAAFVAMVFRVVTITTDMITFFVAWRVGKRVL